MHFCLLTDELIEEYNPAAYFEGFEWEYLTVKPPVRDLVQRLADERRFDVYLNIYEGDDDYDALGLNLIQALEEFGLPFTGSDSSFYSITREQMQLDAEANDLRFARGFNAIDTVDLAQAALLHFPLIVKHPNSFASTGLTRESRVLDVNELSVQFERMADAYGSARVEEFIEGREMSCLVVENADSPSMPFAYHPAEVQFPEAETFLHEEAKWNSWDIHVVPLGDEALAARIQDVSRRFFVATRGSGYARIDFRVRPDGEIVILEINPNCGVLFYGPDHRSHTDLPIQWDAGGHRLFLERIFRAAIKRGDSK